VEEALAIMGAPLSRSGCGGGGRHLIQPCAGPVKYCEGTSECSFFATGTSEGGALAVLGILGKDCTVDLAIVEIMPILAFTESVS
jgi:hypothetical protein